MWEKRIAEASADDYLLVAEVDGEVVGNCGLQPASRSPRRRHAGTIGMVVRDAWHGRGVGTTLIAAVVDLPTTGSAIRASR
jgi:putative acetyltransferase